MSESKWGCARGFTRYYFALLKFSHWSNALPSRLLQLKGDHRLLQPLSEESLLINWKQPFGVHLSCCHLMSPPKKKSHSNLSRQFNSPSLCTSLHLLVFLYSQTISPSPWETGSGNITMNKRGWLEICCVRYNSWYLNTLHRGWKLFR